jgi:sugar phosphate isomerase/epimerase
VSKPIALQLYSVRAQLKEDFVGTMKQVADIGYAGVQTAGMPVSAKEAAKVFADLGLKVPSLHARFPGKADEQSLIEAKEIYGAETICGGFGDEELRDEDGIKRAAEAMQRAVEFAKPYGVGIGYHNHWWEFRNKVGGRYAFDLLMEQAPGAFSEPDVFWVAHGGADPVQVIEQYQPRVPLLHIKDGPVQKGRPHTAVGKGDLDMPTIIKAADPNVLQWLIVELDECATDMMEAVRDSFDYLKSTGLGHGNK